ncbi:hypothetical protein HRG_012520 [Hirsutella rhossiliensis]
MDEDLLVLWLKSGYFVGVSACCSLLGFGVESNVLMQVVLCQRNKSGANDEAVREPQPDANEMFQHTLSFFARTCEIVLRRWKDKDTLSFIHTTLVFMLYMSRLPAAMTHLQGRYPWKLLAKLLNHLLETTKTRSRIDSDEFPGPEKSEGPCPLPEDYALSGLLFAENFFPKGWFSSRNIDDADRYLEPPSKTLKRQERILWIGRRIAASGIWITWCGETDQFGVAEKYDIPL